MINRFITSFQTIWYQLSPSSKRTFVFVLFFNVISSMFETIGLAFVFPFFNMISSQEINPPFLRDFFQQSNLSYIHSMIIVGSGVCFFLVISNLIIYKSQRYNMLRTNLITNELGSVLYRKYLNGDLIFHQNNGPVLLNTKINFLKSIGTGYLNAIVNFLSKFFLTFILFMVLLYINWRAALIASLLLIFLYIFIFFRIKSKIKSLSNSYRGLMKIRQKEIIESFRGIRDIKMSSLENVYVDNFEKIGEQIASSESTRHVLSIFPKYLLETTGFVLLIAFSLTLLSQGKNFVNIISQVIVFSMVGYKLLPSVQVMFQNAISIISQIPLIDDLRKDFQLKVKSNTDNYHCSELTSVVFKNVSVGFDDKVLIDNLNLDLRSGEFLGITGPSGVGKSTLIEIVAGLRSCRNGSLKFNQLEVTSGIRQLCAYVPQNVVILNDTFINNITLRDKNIDQSLLDKAIKIADIHNLISQTGKGLNDELHENGEGFSGGQKQKIGIARAIYMNRPVLILDESTSALDPLIEKEIFNHLSHLGKIVIFVSHKPKLFKACDKILVLEPGKLPNFGDFDYQMKTSNYFKDFVLNDLH